jgi:hypothetical protein
MIRACKLFVLNLHFFLILFAFCSFLRKQEGSSEGAFSPSPSEQDIARLTYLKKQEIERLSKQPALFVWENDIQVEQLFSNLT